MKSVYLTAEKLGYTIEETQQFLRLIERVLGHEGHYSNDPTDPGGETKWGISKRSYPHLNILDLTREEAVVIYLTDFWDKVHTDVMPPLMDYQLLDSAVNSGINQSIRFVQRALGVADDGNFGRHSKAALELADVNDLGFNFLAERLDFMTRLKNWKYHGKGWARRIAQNLRYAAEDN